MKLGRSFSIYTTAGFLKAGIPFLILPILTQHLTPADYGIVSLFNAFERFLMAFIALGIIDTLTFEYFKLDKHAFKTRFSSSIFTVCLMFTFLTAIALILREPLSTFTGIPQPWIYLVPLCCFCFIVSTLVTVILRNQDRPTFFGLYTLGGTLTEVTLTLLFVIPLAMAWEGRLLSHLIIGLLFCGIALLFFRRQEIIGPNIKASEIRNTIIVGIPLIPDAISVFVLELSDRFYLSKMADLSTTGIYSVGSQISMAILILTTAFANAFFPQMYKTLSSENIEARKNIVKITYTFLAVLLICVFGLSFLAGPLIFKYLIDESYSNGAQYVFFISLGYFFLAIHVMFKGYILYNKRMRYMAYVSAISMVLNLILNYFFILKFGPIGAAYSTAISYLVAALFVIYFSVKTEEMPWLFFLTKDDTK